MGWENERMRENERGSLADKGSGDGLVILLAAVDGFFGKQKIK